MGKQRRQRKKYHQPSKSSKDPKHLQSAGSAIKTQPITLAPTSNLFAGLDINVDNLNKNLDTCSVKSFKSDFSNKLPKKDKTKLRRKMLLKKLDVATIAKKKKTKTDNLNSSPLLQSLAKDKNDKKQIKRKGTQKATKRKKYFLNGVNLFKKLINNKEFKANPHKIVSERIANGHAKRLEKHQ
ncbi:hypothetical protein RN001_015121 [Aquatica leii]|uniref:Uncharacterized protein n=1 Tax=Aquatica leii TaxID=1421715 RepID=A0AAN7SBX0_9COLE|nr:hypothetical protein RN001_015121 [Aquatica leii]